MSMRFDTMLFPGGLSKAFTLSYDDGVTHQSNLKKAWLVLPFALEFLCDEKNYAESVYRS